MGVDVIDVGTAPSCKAYGSRFKDSVWPGAIARIVGRDVDEDVEVEAVEVADWLEGLEVGAGTTSTWNVNTDPSLNATDTETGPAG